MTPPTCVLSARRTPLSDADAEILSPDALALVAMMNRVHDSARRALLDRRVERARSLRDGERPDRLASTAWIREAAWQVRPAPADLADRRVEITGPADRKMMVGALNSGARVFLCDLEDALAPTWANLLDGQRNIRDHARGQLSFERPDGRVDVPVDGAATIVVRPRGLHLDQGDVTVDGRPVCGSLFDVTLAAFHGAAALVERGSGLYLYLPKMESHHEAQWWDAVLADLERRLGLPYASVRVTVLIETILAAFEMEEILYALRDRICGLNAGRWDYLFSVIKRFGGEAEHLLPDRSMLTMTVPFMATYATELVSVCHRRGAHAIGGMSAFIPNRRDPEVTERAIAGVRADKEREAGLGYDGTWVAHPDLVPIALEAFDAVLGDAPNQLGRQVPPQDTSRLIDTEVAGATITAAGVRANVSVALRYIAAWLDGLGAVAIDNLMEDAATAEISRSQLWQWIHLEAATADGTPITREHVSREIDAVVAGLVAGGGDADLFGAAAEIVREVSLGDELPEFLTTIAAERLP